MIGILSDSEPIIEDNSYLHMSIGGSIPEYVAPSSLEEFTGSSRLDLKKIRDNLEKAAVDDRINGVILNLGFLQTGYAKVEELQKLIDTYRESGKKIYAYLEFAMTREYLVAIACDSVFMPENSNLFITGVGSELTFYKGFFDKVGIQADFVHVGQFKNAPDQYTRDKISPAQSLVLNDILDQFYSFIITNIAERRNLSEDKVRDLINNQTGFTGKSALANGLVDGTSFKNEIVQILDYYNSPPAKISGQTYSSIPVSSLGLRTKSRIAVIHISGTISSGNDVDDPILGKLAGANTISQNIRSAAKSSYTKAIILRIDSPGGSAIAANIIWKAVKEASEKKAVVASISDYGASGGYYIAMAADTILNSPMSLIGSIGIYAGKFSTEGLYKKVGLGYERLHRGKNAGLFSTNSLWSNSERKVMQSLIEDFYKDFVTKVADSRGLTYDQTDALSQGRVWSGIQGYQNGLIDSTGSFYDAIDLAKKMAQIDEEESVRLSYYPKEKDFFTELYSMVSMNTSFNSILQQTETTLLTRFQNQPLALMPFLITWN
ncbi:MAG: signal peptide peptidase SppA [Calditrichaeota bacterium]|nr:signal peptide peptidase SppA [Calditrichota bacterium]